MAITTAFTTTGKQNCLNGVNNFSNSGGDAFNFALFTSAATLDATTTAYAATNEASGTGYTARGNTLTNNGVSTSGTTAFVDFADTSWSSSTITANGGLIFNTTDSDAAVSVHAFGSDVSSSSGTFTVTFPTADASNAILRLA